MAMRQTALFQLIHFNRQNEVIAAATIAIQNRDDVTHPRLPELEEGHPGRVRLYLSIGVSLPQKRGKFLLKQTPRVKTSWKGNELRNMSKGSYIQLPGMERGGGSQHVSTFFFLPFRFSLVSLDSGYPISTYLDRVCQFKGIRQSFSTGGNLTLNIFQCTHWKSHKMISMHLSPIAPVDTSPDIFEPFLISFISDSL